MRLAAFPLIHQGVLIMTKKRMVMELGMGSSLRQQDYTRAACRAVEDALWHNSLSIADAFGLDRSAMIIEVEIGVQQPEKVDTDKVLQSCLMGRGWFVLFMAVLTCQSLVAALPLSPMRRWWSISILSLQEPHDETYHC
jgi:uncharacterized protein (TIGR02058 family)